MDWEVTDILSDYKKFSENLHLDYEKYADKVEDPDFLVQLARDTLERKLKTFSPDELNELKEIDLFILENITNAAQWLTPDNSEPDASWWWHLDKIVSGEMNKPDTARMFEEMIKQYYTDCVSDRLIMYLKWADDLDLDYDEHSESVDDPDILVQLSRDGLQGQIEEDLSIFSEEDLTKLKRMDLFVLANIDNSSRWLTPDHSKPKSYWWNYLDMIKSGEMETPDVQKIFGGYFDILKGKK